MIERLHQSLLTRRTATRSALNVLWLSVCSLKPLDIEFMKRLHEKVNVIPLIAKADTLTPEECQQFKKQVSGFHSCSQKTPTFLWLSAYGAKLAKHAPIISVDMSSISSSHAARLMQTGSSTQLTSCLCVYMVRLDAVTLNGAETDLSCNTHSDLKCCVQKSQIWCNHTVWLWCASS